MKALAVLALIFAVVVGIAGVQAVAYFHAAQAAYAQRVNA